MPQKHFLFSMLHLISSLCNLSQTHSEIKHERPLMKLVEEVTTDGRMHFSPLTVNLQWLWLWNEVETGVTSSAVSKEVFHSTPPATIEVTTVTDFV